MIVHQLPTCTYPVDCLMACWSRDRSSSPLYNTGLSVAHVEGKDNLTIDFRPGMHILCLWKSPPVVRSILHAELSCPMVVSAMTSEPCSRHISLARERRTCIHQNRRVCTMVCRVGEEANVHLWVLEFLASFRTTYIGRTRNGDEVAVFEPIMPVVVIEMCSLSHPLAQANGASPVRLRPRVHCQLLRLDIGAHHRGCAAPKG